MPSGVVLACSAGVFFFVRENPQRRHEKTDGAGKKRRQYTDLKPAYTKQYIRRLSTDCSQAHTTELQRQVLGQ